MVRISRRIVAGAAGGVLLGAATGLLAPVAAYADDSLSGTYEETDETGTYTWNFSPCGTGCTVANSPDDDSVVNLQFHLSDGKWTGSNPYDIHCRGERVPGTISYTIDAATLAGDYTMTSTADGCGETAGTRTDPQWVQLTKVE